MYNLDADSYDNAHDCRIKKTWLSVSGSSISAITGVFGLSSFVVSSKLLADNVRPKTKCQYVQYKFTLNGSCDIKKFSFLLGVIIEWQLT